MRWAQALEIGAIPEQRRIAAMRHAVIDMARRHSAEAFRETRPTVRVRAQDLAPQREPALRVIPAPDVDVRALIGLARMFRTVSGSHEPPAVRMRTRMQGRHRHQIRHGVIAADTYSGCLGDPS